MKYLFIQYPACSTCRKAKQWLDSRQADYESRHIVNQAPTQEELNEWIDRSKLPLKAFFNTHGVSYKELNLKDKLPAMSREEQLALLSSDGKLIKRPILVGEDMVLVGFNAAVWDEQVK